MLKTTYDSPDDIPEQYRDLYADDGGKWRLTGVEGLKTQADIDNVLRAKAHEVRRRQEAEARWSALGDASPEDILAKLDRIAELEAIAEGKGGEVDKLVDARASARAAPLERELRARQSELEEARKELERMRAIDRKRRIDDEARKALGEVGVIPEAQDDAMLYLSTMLELAEDGVPQTREGAGVPAGIDAAGLLAHLRDHGMRPLWWGANTGAGLRGGKGSALAGDNPWTKGKENLTKQIEIERENPSLAERLRKQAQ
jgi:hypothetical protein